MALVIAFTHLYKNKYRFHLIHLEHPSVQSPSLYFPSARKLQRPVFDQMQSVTVTLVVIGLDHESGHFSTEHHSHRNWLLYYSLLTFYVENWFDTGNSNLHFGDLYKDLNIFTHLSVTHKQIIACNCFSNCLFKEWPAQLVLGLCFLQYHSLPVAPRLHEYFKLTLAVNYICICNMSAGHD